MHGPTAFVFFVEDRAATPWLVLLVAFTTLCLLGIIQE